MIHIKILELEKYQDSSKYERLDGGIYKDLNDVERTNHRVALSFELEEGEDTQYPIEDVLDKYRIHVSEFIKSSNANIMNLELAGKVDNLRLASSIIGKRVYNKDITGEDGKAYVDLIIE